VKTNAHCKVFDEILAGVAVLSGFRAVTLYVDYYNFKLGESIMKQFLSFMSTLLEKAYHRLMLASIMLLVNASSVYAASDDGEAVNQLAGRIDNSMISVLKLLVALSSVLGLALTFFIAPVWLLVAGVAKYNFKKNASIKKPLIAMPIGLAMFMLAGLIRFA